MPNAHSQCKGTLLVGHNTSRVLRLMTRRWVCTQVHVNNAMDQPHPDNYFTSQ